ncbi:MAG: signal peptidase I [Gemmatimonadales bacterium]
MTESDKGGTASSEPATAPVRDPRPAGISRLFSTILVALAFFVGVRTFLIEAYRIPTGSMENTLLVGDFLLVNKAVFGARIPGTHWRTIAFREPQLGDVVVFHPPHEPERNYVKRVVGVAHDTLEMRDKKLYRNGELVDEPWARHDDDRGDSVHPDMKWQSGYLIASHRPKYQPTRDNWGPIVVPQDRFFMLGDNRDNSEDSRYWGFVDREEIRGQPWRVYYSLAPSIGAARSWFERVRWHRLGSSIE